MAKDKENVEFVNEKEEQKELTKYKVKDFLNGSVLIREGFVKQLPFILFIAGLGILYIANRFHSERLLRESVKLQIEVQELRAESIVTASELMFICRQSEVVKMVEERNIDLQESRVPPFRIEQKN